jgi:hypothetical protein
LLAQLEDAQHLRIGKHGGHRIEAAGQRLAHQRHVGLDLLVLLGEQAANTFEPGLISSRMSTMLLAVHSSRARFR